MKIKFEIFPLLLLLLLLAGGLLAQDAESFEVNGLKVIFKKNTATDIIVANLYFRGGVSVLDTRNAGIENYALTVAPKASQNYPKEKLNAELESINTQIDHSSTQDYSSLNLKTVKQNFDKSWQIFTDVVKNPSFNTDDVELEREKILSGIRQRHDDPDNYLDELVDQAYFQNHPYNTEVAGNVSTISAFNAEDLKKYYQDRLQTSDLLLVVVGNIDKEKLQQKVRESFGDLPTGNYQQTLPPEPAHQESSIKVVQRDLPTNYIMGAYSAPAFQDQDRYAMAIASSILRDRVFEEVRTKRGLSYAPAAGYRPNFSGMAFIYVTAVDADSTIKVMMNELKRLRDEPISEEDLQDKVNTFITRHYLGNETNQAQASTLARYELSGLGYQKAANFIQNVKSVTPQDLQDVAQKYINNMQVVIIGNPQELQTSRFFL
ncbi:MAG: pitrilysin family protein [Calditrichia bacterium]